MGSIRCPECNKSASFNTSSNNISITFTLKCKECNRMVIRTGRRENANKIRRIALETWSNISSYEDEY